MVLTDPKQLGIWYHGQSSNDLGLRLLSPLTVGLPDRNLIQVQIPYTSRIIELTSYWGKAVFQERTISISFNYDFQGSLQGGQDMYTKIQKWLYQPQGKAPLVLGHDREYYYMAEVVSSSSREDMRSSGTFNAVFSCYPFKMSINYYNDDNWNRFRFETDHVQLIAHKIYSSYTFSLYNTSPNEVIPTVVSNNNIRIVNDDLTQSEFSSGIDTQEDALFPFKLHSGTNRITVYNNDRQDAMVAILLRLEVV